MRGRRSWRVMPVAPRIVNDVSCATRINDARHFTWQAQHLVRLEGDACCFAHWTSLMRVILRGRHNTW